MSSTNGNSNALPKTADVVILGAGVMGASIAFQLARRKAGKIIVIEKDHVGRGGSGRSSALIRMHYSFAAEVQLALVSLCMFENWKEIVGQPGDFHKTGFVRIVHPNETERLRLNVEMQRKCGAKVELIGKDELHELEPDWNVDDVELCAYEPDSGYGDGAGVAGDLLGAAREMGVEYFSRTQVAAFSVESGQARGIVTDRGTISPPLSSPPLDRGRGRYFSRWGVSFRSSASTTKSQSYARLRTCAAEAARASIPPPRLISARMRTTSF